MVENICRNDACVSGQVIEEPELSHIRKDIKFYRFVISNKRLSDVRDTIIVIAPDALLEGKNIKSGDNICIEGEYRSYNNFETKRLELFMFAKYIYCCDEDTYYNRISLSGYVAKKCDLRVTPLSNRTILDVILAVNRMGNKSSYIPCIIWNLSDEEANDIKIGDKLSIKGRIQSRDYIKFYEEGRCEFKTAYEVSIKSYEKI